MFILQFVCNKVSYIEQTIDKLHFLGKLSSRFLISFEILKIASTIETFVLFLACKFYDLFGIYLFYIPISYGYFT